jgi:hypothetical protein
MSTFIIMGGRHTQGQQQQLQQQPSTSWPIHVCCAHTGHMCAGQASLLVVRAVIEDDTWTHLRPSSAWRLGSTGDRCIIYFTTTAFPWSESSFGPVVFYTFLHSSCFATRETVLLSACRWRLCVRKRHPRSPSPLERNTTTRAPRRVAARLAGRPFSTHSQVP